MRNALAEKMRTKVYASPLNNFIIMFFVYVLSFLIVVSVVYNLIEDAINDEEGREWNSSDHDDEIKRKAKDLNDIDGKY